MNSTELLERRASHGTPRGADVIWRDAHRTTTAVVSERRPSRAFRLALVACVLTLVVGALALRGGDEPVASSPTIEDDVDPSSSDPLPAPLLVTGGTVDEVWAPADPAFDAADLLPSAGSVTLPSSEQDPLFTTMVFARPTDPFRGPIVGIDLLAAGGFEPWGANLDPSELEAYVEQLRRVDGSWTLPASTGLVQVASMVELPDSLADFGWQFDVRLDGDDRVTVQAEASTPDRVADEWRWISREAHGRPGAEVTVTPTDVLGRQGIVIDTGGSQGNEVVWTDGDFVYRLLSSTIEGDTSVGRDATDDVDRLRLVERSEWVDALEAATREPTGVRFARLALVPVLAVMVASAVWFLVRRSYRAAVVVAVSVLMLLWAGEPSATVLAVAIAGLAIAWWLHALERRPARPQRSAEGDSTDAPGT